MIRSIFHYFIHNQYTDFLSVLGSAQQSTESDMIQWNRTQEQRKHWIRQRCAAGFGSKGPRYDRLLLDEKYKVLYCFIPKVGCTTWKNVLVSLHHDEMEINVRKRIHVNVAKVGLNFLGRKSHADQKVILDTYKKFLFVRDPMERVVSAFRDKVQRKKASTIVLDKFVTSRILKFCRRKTTNRENYTLPISFSTFVDYILTYPYGNAHWSKFDHLCRPCNVHYDYVGKFETFTEDSLKILSALYNISKASAQRFILPLNSNPKGKTNSSKTDNYLNQLSPVQLEKLKRHYKVDYELFHYNINK